MDQNILKRLIFIKYMYKKGVEQSYKSYPASQLSLLTFHDAIELFLIFAYFHLGGQKHINDISFMKYWKDISELSDDIEITQEASVGKLNDARVNLKHRGNFTSNLDIESFRATATNFFNENTEKVFGIDFSDISLIDIIVNETAKNLLKEANTFLNENDYINSLIKASKAFYSLLDEYEDKKVGPFGKSLFDFNSSMSSLHHLSTGSDDLLGIGKFVEITKEAIVSMGNALKIISLGIDYKKYAKFRLLTPERVRIEAGPDRYYNTQGQNLDNIKRDDVNFCIDFVIETALTIQEFDFEINIDENFTGVNSILKLRDE